MNEDYLWDRSGPRDEVVVELEQVLRPLRYVPPKPKLNWRMLAAAAAILIALAGSLFVRRGELTSWKVSINGQPATQVRNGQTINTSQNATATLESQEVGEVRVEPGSKLRLNKSAKTEQQFTLQQGTIHAFIWAPPAEFVVDTPAAKTVDLGCQYTLTVSPNGSGDLTVTVGWVAFQSGKLESFIPAGAKCRTRIGRGPGTPYREDAAPRFIAALDHFDTNDDEQSLDAVIKTARQDDALTLWHLLSRTSGEQRAKVFAAFAQKVALPASVTQENILRGDAQSFDAAWDALQLGGTSWWRTWKRAVPAQ
jgi:hypothetical protein